MQVPSIVPTRIGLLSAPALTPASDWSLGLSHLWLVHAGSYVIERASGQCSHFHCLNYNFKSNSDVLAQLHEAAVTSLALTSRKQLLAAGDASGNLTIINLAQASPVTCWRTPCRPTRHQHDLCRDSMTVCYTSCSTLHIRKSLHALVTDTGQQGHQTTPYRPCTKRCLVYRGQFEQHLSKLAALWR